jgi:putative transposase
VNVQGYALRPPAPQLKAHRQYRQITLLDKTFIRRWFRPTTTVAPENLFLRKQLGLFIERKAKPRRATDVIPFTLARLSRLFDRSNALTIVKSDTLIRWHRKGFRLLWKWKSRPRGRRVPLELRKLIVEMATNNPTWGEERIADELLLNVGIRIPPRTVRRYMPKPPRGQTQSNAG